MTPSAEPPFESQPRGISLDELTQAFARVMEDEGGGGKGGEGEKGEKGGEKGEKGVESLYSEADATAAPIDAADSASTGEEAQASPQPPADDACPICPRTIFEAMLFVGNRENRPLAPARAAELMRDVAVEEIPTLVDELNRRYATAGAPFHVVGEGDGYRLTLHREFCPLRDRFYVRIREARLSQAAIDVLALVAYQQPIAAEKIGRLRGKPSSHVLSQLVRRGLLRIERPEDNRRLAYYCTTDRFLRLFNLESLDDLPRSEDPEPT